MSRKAAFQDVYKRQEFDIAYLCRLMNISRSTLYRLFEEEVGCSPSEYLIRYRVTQARKMLSCLLYTSRCV